MSYTKEQEIQRQFLDEAQEYLGTLESAVLGIASHRVDGHKINAALRAAHSIKGGAGMMGFHTLSTLAHQLEDSFKVLKTQKSIAIDTNLEHLLLKGVGCLRHVIECDRLGHLVEPNWLQTQAHPIFEQLHALLGDPQEEDAVSILSPEEGQDIVPLLFETEVEGCLQRLETVLANPDMPCLREEVLILAQELGGLGEMLQLPTFTSFCQSVSQALETDPDQVVVIAQAALQAWRHSQTLVLTGQRDRLPTQIRYDTAAEAIVLPTAESQPGAEESAVWLPEPELLETSLLNGLEATVASQLLETELEEVAEPIHVVTAAPIPDELPPSPGQTRSVPDYKVLELTPDPDPAQPDADQDATVRVPVRQLNQLNDLFGELTIERNGLDLYLQRLRKLTAVLSQRVRTLEKTNTHLRTAFNKTTTDSFSLPSLEASIKALPAARSQRSELPSAPAQREAKPSMPASVPHSKFDALEMDRYSDTHLLSQAVMETIVQIQEVTSDIELSLEDANQTAHELNKTAKQLQTNLTHLRMRPFSDIVDRFPRAVRELSLQYRKSVELKVTGRMTLIDRGILEALNEPLLHLIRNAFDHGIEDPDLRQERNKPETGLIEIQATHQGNRTLITVRDDGGGIPLHKIRLRAEQMGLDPTLLAAASDEELLSLIFEPGFSTTDQVTALSGRGVGMDVVRDRLKQVRGEIKVATQAGIGTTFTLSVPYTLSIARILLVESNGMLLAFPADVVTEVQLLRPQDVLTTVGNPVLNWQGTLVQLIQLSRWLTFNCVRYPHTLETPPTINSDAVLMVKHGSQLIGLQIDRCWGEQEVAVRRVESNLPMPSGFSNCTILGDGRVVPLVNLPELLQWIVSCERCPDERPVQLPSAVPSGVPKALPPLSRLQLPPLTPLPELPDSGKDTLLIVDDSINVRRFLALTLERSGYQVIQAKDGQDAFEKLQAGLSVRAIVCDIEMPRLDGYGLLSKLKADEGLKQVPVIMLTSRSGAKHQQLAMSLGAAAYFSKPYNEQSLLRTIEQLIHLSLCPR